MAHPLLLSDSAVEHSNDELHGVLRRDVLPDAQHPPSLGLRHGGRLRVALNIPRELRLPVLDVRGRDRPVLGAPVPEAAVDEHRQAATGAAALGVMGHEVVVVGRSQVVQRYGQFHPALLSRLPRGSASNTGKGLLKNRNEFGSDVLIKLDSLTHLR